MHASDEKRLTLKTSREFRETLESVSRKLGVDEARALSIAMSVMQDVLNDQLQLVRHNDESRSRSSRRRNKRSEATKPSAVETEAG